MEKKEKKRAAKKKIDILSSITLKLSNEKLVLQDTHLF